MSSTLGYAALVGLVHLLGACTESNPYQDVCGNGIHEPLNGEECDDGPGNSPSGACTHHCLIAICGDGLVEAESEECDNGPDNSPEGPCTPACTVPRCGDGIQQADEACDEGPDNKAAADGLGGCSVLCVPLPVCGDGVVHPEFEECDDGNSSDNDACLNDCTAASCGDGFIFAGVEMCDDGNDDESDGCLSNCEIATCGDGVVHAGIEECDDGNQSDADGCLMGCVAATCGDGLIWEGVEECDNGDQNGGDGCNAECVEDRLVFITAEPFGPDQMSGLDGAYQKCAKVAFESGHPTPYSFRAWISDGESAPTDRFDHSRGRYVLSTGDVVAESWEDLTDGALLHPIDRTFDGKLLSEVPVWTATRSDGSGYADGTCEGWTEGTTEKARYGYSDLVDAGWTDYGAGLGTCSGGGHLYCFEARK